jgi:hypothetical protein
MYILNRFFKICDSHFSKIVTISKNLHLFLKNIFNRRKSFYLFNNDTFNNNNEIIIILTKTGHGTRQSTDGIISYTLKYNLQGREENKITRRDKIVTISVLNNKQDIHLRNTERRRIGTVRSLGIARMFKPLNGAPNLTFSPHMILLHKTV